MTTINLQLFDFADGLQLRSISKASAPWFIASDVCSALGLVNVSQTLTDHVDPEDKAIQPIGLPGKAPLIVNESGLYALILRSKKPEAKKFQKWITSVVLPALRTGSVYVVGQERVDLATMTYEQSRIHIEGLQALVAEAEAIRWAKSRADRVDYREAMKFISRRSYKARA